MTDNCSPCLDCTSLPTGPVCPDPPQYTANQCPDPQPTDCIYYTGPDESCLGVAGSGTPMTLTALLVKLFTYITTLLGRISSASLSITRTGACSDLLSIELIPSTQSGNILILGNDGRPFVPPTVVTMQGSKCISYQSTGPVGNVTWVGVLDFECIADNITEFAIQCVAPTSVTVTGITTSTAQISFGTTPGLTYDILLNNQVLATNVSSPYDLTGMAPNTNYTIAVRVNCASGNTSETIVTFTTQPILSCNTPSNLQITSV